MRIVIFCIWDEDEDFSGLSLAKYLGAVKFTISDDSLLRLLFFSWFLSVLILQVIEVEMFKYELIVGSLTWPASCCAHSRRKRSTCFFVANIYDLMQNTTQT